MWQWDMWQCIIGFVCGKKRVLRAVNVSELQVAIRLSLKRNEFSDIKRYVGGEVPFKWLEVMVDKKQLIEFQHYIIWGMTIFTPSRLTKLPTLE